ncbi:hypothetical protein [Myxococcus sp. CA039A]|uniref:hypothetical protein n=1 Tax=Myxococcus sp. CA039A TaxID=2741737 RepID=UPI00157B2DDC|nr:hypothetical protein [Myxococcus sp. CA039A]NTX52960.1 hypothetical protein [Myxococcus sp. CA039A]
MCEQPPAPVLDGTPTRDAWWPGSEATRGLLALTLVGLLIHVPRAEAYPIPPVTLWPLTQEAELIVWADVERVRIAPRERDEQGMPWDDDEIATLKIRETWKGSVRPGERVEVLFSSDIMCPAPPRYEPGRSVIAFLSNGNGRWWTVGMSYGTRHPTNPADVDAYRRGVTAARGAQARSAPPQRKETANSEQEHLDWQVRAALHPATRWDGLYELSQGAAALTRAQRQQLAHGFTTQPSFDHTVAQMLTTLRGFPHKDFDRATANVLETVFVEQGAPPWISKAFDLLRERHGEKPEPRTPWYKRVPSKSPIEAKAEQARALARDWLSFKKRHGLKPRRLVFLAAPLVDETGGTIPF